MGKIVVSQTKLVTEEIMALDLGNGYFTTYLTMEFSDDGTFTKEHIVVPTAGTVSCYVSENEVYWSSFFNSLNISVNIQDFIRPSASGIISAIKAIPAGITGATHWRIIIGRE